MSNRPGLPADIDIFSPPREEYKKPGSGFGEAKVVG